MKNSILLKISAGIMMVIGVVNLLKGYRILTGIEILPDSPLTASVTEMRIAGIATLIIAALLILAGIFLFQGRSVWIFSVFAIIAFVVISIIDYSLIEGEALATGAVIDITFGLIVLIIIYLGKKRDANVVKE